jgi:hypothetical protein
MTGIRRIDKSSRAFSFRISGQANAAFVQTLSAIAPKAVVDVPQDPTSQIRLFSSQSDLPTCFLLLSPFFSFVLLPSPPSTPPRGLRRSQTNSAVIARSQRQRKERQLTTNPAGFFCPPPSSSNALSTTRFRKTSNPRRTPETARPPWRLR